MNNTINMDHIMQQIEDERSTAQTKADYQKDELRTFLLSKMVTYIKVTFSGSGDSGSIDDIDIQWATDPVPQEDANEVHQRVEEWCYLWLEGSGVDWYNNEGGQGEIEIDLRNPPFTFNGYVDYNVMSVERGYDQEEIF